MEEEERITGFPAVPQSVVGEIQEAHPDVENNHRPTPAVDGVHGPGEIEPRCGRRPDPIVDRRKDEEGHASDTQNQVQEPIPADCLSKTLLSDENVPADEEDQHEGEIRPAIGFREEWLENKTGEDEGYDEHQQAASPFGKPCESGDEPFSRVRIQP